MTEQDHDHDEATEDETTDPELSEISESSADETSDETTPEGDTFPRAYVEQLRDESARYRQRAGRTDEAETRLRTEVIAANAGDLADPADLLVYVEADTLTDDDGWPDPALVAAAVAQLIADKPHLAQRRPRGDIGQGASRTGDTVNLATIMREKAT